MADGLWPREYQDNIFISRVRDRVGQENFDPNRNVNRALHWTTIGLLDGESVRGLYCREEGDVV